MKKIVAVTILVFIVMLLTSCQEQNSADNKKTKIELTVSNIDSEEYQVVLNFESHKGEMNYDWNVNVGSGEITSNNQESKYIIDLVDFYD